MKKLFLTLIISVVVTTTSFGQIIFYEDNPKKTELMNFINEWWRTPYKYGGETKRGIDCSAFTGKLMNTVFDTKLPRTAREQYANSKRITKEELNYNDLVFFRSKNSSTWHVGVYLGDGWFVHSSSKYGVTFSNLNYGSYKNRFYGAGRVI
jgi:lipoprotein Spr